ncbi:hypothetical protein M595_2314 [Lyngbya aestuarii BL J]|uniref:Uncharacterized protein n=1 Tax=Lyngbya aestuarii BL J TaxID=1348334 RepID=U7QIJ1_9CYAN|nr:hypothetical protein M595_2314 [Lyngbya aestuarii BL J]
MLIIQEQKDFFSLHYYSGVLFFKIIFLRYRTTRRANYSFSCIPGLDATLKRWFHCFEVTQI